MPNPASARVAIVLGTLAFAWVEWLVFELMRLPYRPPYDMNTFLGTEMFAIPYVMGFIAIVWLWLIIKWFHKFTPARYDYITFASLLLLLATMLGLVVAYPLWPVTPAELLRGY